MGNRNRSVYSDLKIFYHTDKIRDFLEERRTAPIYIRIKPTNLCNQNCYYCGSKDDNVPEDRYFPRNASIPWEKMQEIVEDIADMGVKAVTLSGGGEPLVYHHIVELLALIKEKGIDYSIITNGQALEKKAAELLAEAKWVRISLESASGETYKSIRGVETFERVISNMNHFAKIKSSNCTLGINCVVTKDNYEELYELCKIVKEAGADNIKFSPLRIDGDIGAYHATIKECVKEQLEKAKKEFNDDNFQIIDKYDDDWSLDTEFEKAYSRCMIQEFFTVIGADCKVYFCHQRAYTKGGDIGDLKNCSFKELWFSKETIDKARGMNACNECNFRCVFDERNMLLNDLKSIDINHINFI